jgi:hypothetical protein
MTASTDKKFPNKSTKKSLNKSFGLTKNPQTRHLSPSSSCQAVLGLQAMNKGYSDICILFADTSFAEIFKYDAKSYGSDGGLPFQRLYPFATDDDEDHLLMRIFNAMHTGIPLSEYATLIGLNYGCLSCHITVTPISNLVSHTPQSQCISQKEDGLRPQLTLTQVPIPSLVCDNFIDVSIVNDFLSLWQVDGDDSGQSKSESLLTNAEPYEQSATNALEEMTIKSSQASPTDMLCGPESIELPSTSGHVLAVKHFASSSSGQIMTSKRNMFAILTIRCSNVLESLAHYSQRFVR